jgi:hypothetical protein
LAIWIAAGDETGSWDIVNGRFGSSFTGLAWVLASLPAWDAALQMTVGGVTALEAFSHSIADRLPAGATLFETSSKYHLKDVWTCFRGENRDVSLDIPQDDPRLELIRADAIWLLRDSGLGVLTTGGDASDARAAGLGLSGDGLRERARAFAGLMTVALPFLPGGDSLNMMAEGRTESAIADAVRPGQGAGQNMVRYQEPYRDFLGRLTEDVRRAAVRCRTFVADGKVADSIYSKGGSELGSFLSGVRGAPFLQAHSLEAIAAMNGIADLAAAFAPRPAGAGCRLMPPRGPSGNFWAGNYRELRHAIAT